MNEIVDIIKNKIKEDESPILEFKRQWYWDDDTLADEMSDKWGEFIKDIISLANGYLGFVGKTRYLIIGYDEELSEILNINFHCVKQLKDIRKFKKDLTQKLEKYTSPSLLTFDVERIEIDNLSLLVFKIPSPCHITEIKNELQTKTRHIDPGVILVRKGQKTDEIRFATPSEITELTEEFKRFKDNKKFDETNSKKIINKERSIEKTIQLYIDKNSSYSLDINYPISYKNWSDNIVFEVFKISEKLGGFKEFLYLHENASQGKTLGYLKSGNLITNFASLIILTERPNDIKDVEKRKLSIKSIFNTERVFFIDEFGYEYLYGECLPYYVKYELPVYVDSFIDDYEEENKTALNELQEWYLHEAEPLLVIKGYGGIGKTTLAKQFLDYVYDNNKNTGILFIDSPSIIDDLARRVDSDKKIDDIYDFYQAQIKKESDGVTRFSKDLLKLSIDNGSLIIVLDGIDEVIARLGSKFDLNSFLESICNSYSNELDKAKILITCRDHFWDSIGKNIHIPEIILKPFNKELAIDFFIQAFKGDLHKIEKAMLLANEFATTHDLNKKIESIYIPYILDMIAYLIKTQSEKINKTFPKNNLLSDKSPNDFILATVCEREIKKLYNLSIDSQIKFFIKMSVNNNGCLSLYDIKPILIQITTSEVDDKLIDKLKGHPLLTCANNKILFRYDFFNYYFKIIYIAQFFSSKEIEKIDEKYIEIIGSYIKYESSFTEALCDRVPYDEELILFCINSIEYLKDKISENNTEENYKLQRAISSFFIFLVSALQASDKHHNTELRTKLMNDVFFSNGQYNGLYLINIFGQNKITFDFRKNIAGSRYFCERFLGVLPKNQQKLRDRYAFGCPSRPGHSFATQQGVAHMLSND